MRCSGTLGLYVAGEGAPSWRFRRGLAFRVFRFLLDGQFPLPYVSTSRDQLHVSTLRHGECTSGGRLAETCGAVSDKVLTQVAPVLLRKT